MPQHQKHLLTTIHLFEKSEKKNHVTVLMEPEKAWYEFSIFLTKTQSSKQTLLILKTIQKSTQTTNDITPENVTSTHAGERTCILTATTDSLVCSRRFHMARTKRKSMIIAERQANFSVFLNKLSTWKSKRLN